MPQDAVETLFYDTHAHLDFPDFASDLEQVIHRASAAGIQKIITIGTDWESSARSIQLAERFENIFAVVGWHPGAAEAAPPEIRAHLKKLAAHPKVVAIGETGLDYYRLPSTQENGRMEDDLPIKKKQSELFRQHLEVAADCGLNCVIHQRAAMEDTLEVLSEFSHQVRGVFHCFVDDPLTAKKVLALGSLVSFTGIATFKSAQIVRETIGGIRLDQFMLETDCPYLAPVPYRGKRCEPAYVKDIAQRIVEIKGCTLQDLSRATCATAKDFFSKMETP